ncbi:hypothetical protein BXO2_20130, partial [Xanthomonas oryzae pv. oryzae]
GLARTGRADNGDTVAFTDRQADVVEDVECSLRATDGLADLANVDGGAGAGAVGQAVDEESPNA